MQPMKPRDRQATLSAAVEPNAEELLNEYERLLAARFSRDPSVSAIAKFGGRVVDPDARLKELYRLLFPTEPTR